MWFKRKKQVEKNNESSLKNMTDFTLLDPRAVDKDIQTLVNIAIKNQYYAICVNPINILAAKHYISLSVRKDIKVVSVIGFPLGANTLQTKVYEAKQALSDGADELDVVINIAKAKENDFAYIKNELSRIVRIARGKVVKAIIETCYLTREEIKEICKVCLKAKVDFIKTSSGYGTGGATVDDVFLIKEVVKDKCLIKASGGIKTKAQAEELIRAGAQRIGTSRILE